jgi:hypothetical protein
MPQLIIIIVFFALSMIRAVIKSANEKAEKERRLAQRGAPDRKQRVQGEIDAFLTEVGGGNSKKTGGQRERQQKTEVRQDRAQRDQQERHRQQKIQQNREATRVRRQKESQAATAPQRQVGSGISEHVDKYINQHVLEHIDHDVEEYVEATIVDSVESHLGTRRGQMPGQTRTTTTKKSATARAVAALLKDPASVRNAILINEILAPPRSLRK